MTPSNNEVTELLRDAQGGNEQAVERLLGLHRDQLVRAVRQRLDRAIARRVDASDVVQEVLLEASRRLPEYLKNPTMPFPSWLRCLARDRVIDMHRKHRAAGRRSVDREEHPASAPDASSPDLLAGLRDPRVTPAAAALRNEFQSRFFNALEELDDDDKNVLLMRHFEQMNNSEVADALGLSQPAAGMRYLRALRRLRAVLERNDPPSIDGG